MTVSFKISNDEDLKAFRKEALKFAGYSRFHALHRLKAPVVITIEEGRGLSQHRYYRMLLSLLSNDTGYTPDEINGRLKQIHFGSDIPDTISRGDCQSLIMMAKQIATFMGMDLPDEAD